MPVTTILFDFMGTCLDWHSSITAALPQTLSADLRSQFALEWRQTYFDSNEARRTRGNGIEPFQTTMEKTLDEVLNRPQWAPVQELDALRTIAPPNLAAKSQVVQAWFSQPAWPDVAPALSALKAHGYECHVHANGTTRLQLDLCKSSHLDFGGVLLSSQMLGSYKPAPENYRRALELLDREAGECVLVAAHAYDLRGAKGVGEKTIYVRRWTDDVQEDQEKLKGEFDVYLDGMEGLVEAVERLG